jgi:hypothetical protein
LGGQAEQKGQGERETKGPNIEGTNDRMMYIKNIKSKARIYM